MKYFNDTTHNIQMDGANPPAKRRKVIASSQPSTLLEVYLLRELVALILEYVQLPFKCIQTLPDRSQSTCFRVDVSNNERYICMRYNGSVHVWDIQQKQYIKTLCEGVSGITVSQDSKYLIGVGARFYLYVHSIHQNFKILRAASHSYTVTKFTLSPTGRYIVSALDNGSIIVWDTSLSYENMYRYSYITTLKGHHSGRVSALVMTSDDRYIVSGSQDGTIKIWYGQDYYVCKQTIKSTGCISSIAIFSSTEYKHIVSASYDETCLRIWDFTGHLIRMIDHCCGIRSVASSNRYIISVSIDKTARVWDVHQNYQCVQIISGNLNISNSGRYVINHLDTKIIQVWKLTH